MSGPFSDLTDTLFADKSVLSESYQPEEILERDEEIEAFSHALQDVLFGREPENIFLYGKAGLGKTAVTKYMMSELQSEVFEREEVDDLHVHEINCNGKTLFMVVRRLVNELLPADASPFPKRGLGTGDAFDELYAQLDRIGGTHLIVFDEIDHLDDVDTLLYELPRARSNGHITESLVGIVGISNNYTFRQSLSAKVKDTLMETEISFSPYDAGELRTILHDRADRAFVDGACDESAIAKAAALSAQDMGNARQAIDLLRVGAEVAERDGDETVTDDHIEDARTLVQRGRLRNKIRDQTEHAQYILETIAKLEERNEVPARSKEIQEGYERVAEAYGATPLTTLKSIQDHLSDLHMLGFLVRHERNKGLSGGQYYEYELDLDPMIVLETREEIVQAAD
ncbi:orc1/cdc6 family replication initiation protein [Halopiger xanaduensis]|uniref:ORC1-type DNA replication protein n=1 Tax=Halopiger xanaduensis (strain DSM 18323 / JCM 14033 / SH-6) TaxID=797210 RepID=F8D520_HALXS|nr:orc1/cdc6 family replication initiation protein [Halopiger xanaduensis]AEH38785.1 Cell division control protein 6-like protein [Halopiger xanaduensis SH-6]